MHFVQHWFNLADAAREDALLDSTSLLRFVGIGLGREWVPDAITLLKFRRLLEKHRLGEALFAKFGEVLQAHGMKAGQRWYFGMKLHIGVDSETGLAHTAVVTAANMHGEHPLPDLLRGQEERVYGDCA